MNALLISLLILIPAPSSDDEPTGSAPVLQFLKWNKGSFEATTTVTEAVPVTKTFVVNVNGKQETRTVTAFEYVQKTIISNLDAKNAEVYGIDGKKIDEATWQKALAAGAVVAVVRDGKLPHESYRRIFREGTIIVVFKAAAPMIVPPPPIIPPAPVK